MDENHVSGTARNLGDKIEEGVGGLPAIPKPKFKVSLIRRAALRRTYTGKQRTLLARPPPASTSGFARLSRRSLIPLPL